VDYSTTDMTTITLLFLIPLIRSNISLLVVLVDRLNDVDLAIRHCHGIKPVIRIRA
jgi:hypothetical protein